MLRHHTLIQSCPLVCLEPSMPMVKEGKHMMATLHSCRKVAMLALWLCSLPIEPSILLMYSAWGTKEMSQLISTIIVWCWELKKTQKKTVLAKVGKKLH